jgi:hypothetical protein
MGHPAASVASPPTGKRRFVRTPGFVVLLVAPFLGGRYDLTAGGLATLFALWWLNRRR